MSGDMPDWLSELVSAPEDEEPLQRAAPVDVGPRPSSTDVQASRRGVPQEAAPESLDMMADLRSDLAAQEVAPVVEPKKPQSRSRYVVGGLLPWQAFFLSVLLFLDVAVIGMLFLVMLGRVVP